MNYPASTCSFCNMQDHDTNHLFNCTAIPITLTVRDLWTRPIEAARLIAQWEDKLVSHLMAPQFKEDKEQQH